MKQLIAGLLLLATSLGFSQNDIHWDGKYQLKLSDFQSPATQIGNVNVYSLHTTSGVNFSFYMSNFEFMFTKNFNSKVDNIFKRDAASLVSPDESIANDIVAFAQYQFDLSELYARKFRKKLFEEKGTFSNVGFFKPIYDDIQKELSERDTNAGKSTDMGRNKAGLQALHQHLLMEIQELADFCKECKSLKRQK